MNEKSPALRDAGLFHWARFMQAPISLVGASLLAMAADQSTMMLVCFRYREQARSHKGIAVLFLQRN
ncbi:hypothetical protein, partial [Pseudomonas mediterranea]|uniref:hypothetical protein n=1 Tax=Pseudomonas mediterranea TaxID=183795 RepID=UPI0019D401EC